MTGDTIEDDTNLSFFLAIKNGNPVDALRLRARLAGPASSLDVILRSNDLALLYRAYARLCGPITVLYNGTATSYFDPRCSTSASTPLLLRRRNLFLRLLPDPREEVKIVARPCYRVGKEMFRVGDNLLNPLIHSDQSLEMACTGHTDAAAELSRQLVSFRSDYYTACGNSEYLFMAHAILIGPLCVIDNRKSKPYARVYSRASRSPPAGRPATVL